MCIDSVVQLASNQWSPDAFQFGRNVTASSDGDGEYAQVGQVSVLSIYLPKVIDTAECADLFLLVGK